MLNVLRQRAGSWVVKVLLMLLVVSFAIWGIGDVFFRGSRNPTVASVGGSEISAAELADGFNRALNNLQQRLGNSIDRQQAIRFGLMQQTLQDLVARRLIDLRARDMGLTVADDTLRQMVTDNPVFQTAGKFDRDRFEQLLRANGMTENGYLASLRQDVVRSALTGSLAGPVAVPATLVDSLYRYRNEQRRGRYVAVKTASITDVPEPTDDQLTAFHDDHKDKYTTPELRKLTFVTLQPEDLVGEVEVSDQQVEAEYQAKIDRYRSPERRTVAQLLAPDKATIEKAAQQVTEGTGFEQVASALADQGVHNDQLDDITRPDLPPELADVVFALSEGEVSQPVQSPFGWHLFKVSKITPEAVVPLSVVHDELAKELALNEAKDRLPDLATKLDDQLAAGDSLAAAAAAVGLATRSLPPVDATGKDADGKRPDGLPAWPEFLKIAYETPAGEQSLLEETEAGGYFVLKVDEVVPPRVRPVDEVRPQLVAAWQAEQRHDLAQKRAEDLLKRLQDAATLDTVAAAEQLEVTPIKPVKRDAPGSEQGINRGVVRALFATAPGQVADHVIEQSDGFALVTTDEVIAADPAADPDGVKQLRAELETGLRNDLIAQFEAELRRDYRVEIDGAAINRVIGADGQLPSGPTPRMPNPGLF
jgi:peptidyl-prolyl cis-trans isomerase D